MQALRPHGAEVTQISQSPNGNLVATSSVDKTIFIFNRNATNLTPVGFVSATGAVNDFIWRSDSILLAWCANSTVCQIQLPTDDQVDTSKSFKLENAAITAYKFKSCKSRLRRQRDKAKFDDNYATVKAKCEKQLKEAQKRAKERGTTIVCLKDTSKGRVAAL